MKKSLHCLWVLLVSLGVIALVGLGYFYRWSLFSISVYSMSFYGFFAIVHFALQIPIALKNRRHSPRNEYQPSVSVVIPTYKEKEDILELCLKSVAEQTYLNIKQVILSNDGDDEYILDIFKRQAKKGWFYLQNGHHGKRHAMHKAFDLVDNEITVCIDSDTWLSKDAIERLVDAFSDPLVGCATGDVGVLPPKSNLLGKLTELRYWFAFNIERAAQSFFGVMSCVSGPFGAYRTSVLRFIKDRWLHQKFLGNHCTFGDDRHLTNLVLSDGYKSRFVPECFAFTDIPYTLGKWLRQQLRWSRSFYREYILNIKSFHRHNAWLAYDLTYQAVFPLFLLANILLIFWLAVTHNPAYALMWVSILLFFGIVRGLIGTIKTGRIEFMAFALYGFIYAAMLLPLKLYALATVWKTNWM